MIILNWIPELFLLSILFVCLVVINFKMWSYRSLSLFVAAITGVALVYFLFRQDLAFFDSPLKTIYSDSLSYFGKLLSLLSLIVFTVGFHFHRQINFKAKQTTTLFLIFYSLFTIGLCQANNMVLFLACALGIYSSASTLILIESNQSQAWIQVFRQKALSFGVWIAVIAMLTIYGTSLFGSIYISDWMQVLPKLSSGVFELFVFGFLILLASVIPLGGLIHSGNAPLGLGVLYYGLFLILSVFWLRVGVPFFNVSVLLPKANAQVLIALVLGLFTIRHAIKTLRTRDHHQWYASAIPTILGLALFLVLLSSEEALPAFYCISISILFTLSLVSHAFLDTDYRHKGMIVFSMIALLGAPPLVLGEQFYRMIHHEVSSGNLVAGVVMFVSWFVLSVAVTQMTSKILLVRITGVAQRRMIFSELFFIGIYLACVISLTAFRPQVISFLNDHPVLNLW